MMMFLDLDHIVVPGQNGQLFHFETKLSLSMSIVKTEQKVICTLHTDHHHLLHLLLSIQSFRNHILITKIYLYKFKDNTLVHLEDRYMFTHITRHLCLS